MTNVVRKPKRFVLPGSRPQLRQRPPEADSARLEPPVDAPAVNDGTPFVETTYGQCRWIVSEWPTVDVRNVKCCGEQVVTGYSWCAVHCDMAFTHGLNLYRSLPTTRPEPLPEYRMLLVSVPDKAAGPEVLDKPAGSRPARQS